MNKREIKQHFRKNFLFDVRKERIIYAYLCKEKLNRKQKKLLTDETKFKSYQSWKAYIVGRYEMYTKESLIEFSRAVNLLLRESKKFDEYNKSIGIAYFSVVLSSLLTHFIAEVVKNIDLMFILTFLEAIFVFVLVINVYKGLEGEDTYFYEDIKSIIDQMIDEKG